MANHSTTDSGAVQATDRLEILPTDLLDQARPLVEDFRRLARKLDVSLGWHYLLDLPWAAQQLAPFIPETRILDAGGGTGAMQWWLAGRGVDVSSVDRRDRSDLGVRFRAWCHVRGFRPDDLRPFPSKSRPSVRALLPPKRVWNWPRKLTRTVTMINFKEPTPAEGCGTVTIYNQDLKYMPDIEGDSLDGVVSISSLEHNNPNDLQDIVKELMRVLKPGCKLIATLGAAKEHDWFHEPSQGWCYTESTLRDIFGLAPDCPSNYKCYDELFAELRNCAELRKNLPHGYFKSGNNGMPWGEWDPQYQPVGVVKVKSGEPTHDGSD